MSEGFPYFSTAGIVILLAGYRYFGRNFWPQFLVALPVATFIGMAPIRNHAEGPVHWAIWLGYIALYACIGLAIFWLDKRFKFTHWEKNPD
jgi:hypothetical protein